MRHAILGAGGVGGLVGAALAHAGDSVTVVLRPEAIASYPPSLSLDSPFGKFAVPVERTAVVSEPFDVLWVAVKATQLDSGLSSISAGTQPDAIVPLLNGIDHVALLRSRFGFERVVPATIAIESEQVAPGKIVHRSSFARLNVSSIGRDRLAPAIEKLRQFGFTCQFLDDEPTLLWSKLAFLAPIALTSTAAARNKGELVGDPAWRQRLEACVAEACAVATANGAKVDPANILKFMESLKPEARSSMQKDVAAGKPPELDAIAGPILRGAREARLGGAGHTGTGRSGGCSDQRRKSTLAISRRRAERCLELEVSLGAKQHETPAGWRARPAYCLKICASPATSERCRQRWPADASAGR